MAFRRISFIFHQTYYIHTRNLAVYKRPIGATVYFDGWTEKLQERDIFSLSEKKSWERVYYPFAWLPSKYTSVAPIGLLYSARFLVPSIVEKYITHRPAKGEFI